MSQKRLKKQRFVAFFALFFNKKKRKAMNLRGYHRFNYMQHWVHVNTQEVKLSNISLFFNSCVTDRQMVPYLECSHPLVKWITCKKTKKKQKTTTNGNPGYSKDVMDHIGCSGWAWKVSEILQKRAVLKVLRFGYEYKFSADKCRMFKLVSLPKKCILELLNDHIDVCFLGGFEIRPKCRENQCLFRSNYLLPWGF